MATSDRDLVSQLPALRRALVDVAEPSKAPAMAAYMKDNFVFLGVSARPRRAAQRFVSTAARRVEPAEILRFADACWVEDERELQYVAVDILVGQAARLDRTHLAAVERLISTKSWWDTVDLLAARVVGPMVLNDPELAPEMDVWIDSTNLWIARTAVLHQLTFGPNTDASRLFAFGDRRAADTRFFIRKALGWALRQYARTDPVAVRQYVASRDNELSSLTKREALKHLSSCTTPGQP